MDEVSAILERLKKTTETSNNSKLSSALGLNHSTVSTWKARNKIPYDILIDVSNNFNCSLDWLIKGEGSSTNATNNHVNLPFYEISASAGNGTLVENEELAHNISFRAEWLRKDLGVNPNDIFVMLTKGDSMDPTIKEDALIMVDKNTQKHINGIYVLRFNGELLVKRLQFTMSNTIKVISDNKAYDTEEINPEQLTGTDLEIIGRVVWSGQRM
jgi:phage repressor protein C with HTH and peptisase S24 domain